MTKKFEISIISGIPAKTHLDRKSALNEANVLKIMNHPNIIRYECNFEIEGNLHLMMEYADKGALSTYISVYIFLIFIYVYFISYLGIYNLMKTINYELFRSKNNQLKKTKFFEFFLKLSLASRICTPEKFFTET